MNGQRRMVFDEDSGQVDHLPSAPPGTTTFGNEMEPLVRSVVERARR